MSKNAYRFTEHSFRRYEAILAQVVEYHPADVAINPAPLAIETVRCRLPDAAKSFLENRWPSSLVDHEKLTAIWPLCQVIVNGAGLIVRARRTPYVDNVQPFTTNSVIKGEIPLETSYPLDEPGRRVFAAATAQPKTSEFIAVNRPSAEVLKALLFLCDHNTFQAPLRVYNLAADLKEYMFTQEDFFNIGFDFPDATTCVIT